MANFVCVNSSNLYLLVHMTNGVSLPRCPFYPSAQPFDPPPPPLPPPPGPGTEVRIRQNQHQLLLKHFIVAMKGAAVGKVGGGRISSPSSSRSAGLDTRTVLRSFFFDFLYDFPFLFISHVLFHLECCNSPFLRGS